MAERTAEEFGVFAEERRPWLTDVARKVAWGQGENLRADHAKEIIQTALVNVLSRGPWARMEEGQLAAYLQQAVVNGTKDFLRDSRVESIGRVQYAQACRRWLWRPDVEENSWHLVLTVRAAVDRLPLPQQAVLHGHYWQGLSITAISQGERVSRKTVHKHHARALESLRVWLAELGKGRRRTGRPVSRSLPAGVMTPPNLAA